MKQNPLCTCHCAQYPAEKESYPLSFKGYATPNLTPTVSSVTLVENKQNFPNLKLTSAQQSLYFLKKKVSLFAFSTQSYPITFSYLLFPHQDKLLPNSSSPTSQNCNILIMNSENPCQAIFFQFQMFPQRNPTMYKMNRAYISSM